MTGSNPAPSRDLASAAILRHISAADSGECRLDGSVAASASRSHSSAC